MMWYEYLIAAFALLVVAAPIIRHFVNKKKGKKSCGCGCGCGCCSACGKCKPEDGETTKQ